MPAAAGPRELARVSSQTIAGVPLPPDLLEKGAHRAGFLGLICAITAPASWFIEYWFQPARVLLPNAPDLPQAAAIGLMIAGLAMFFVSRARLPRSLVLDFGLVFEVLGAFGIALSEHAVGLPPEAPVRGVSWACLWIALWITTVPASQGKAALAAIAAALMSPVAMLAASNLTGAPMPTAGQAAVLLLPNFVVAVWAIPVSRYLYRLTTQAGRARELGSYQLAERIDHGGMGEVWRARHRLLARDAAIKLVQPLADEADNELLQKRFEREALATARLRSPHTVALYDFGRSGDGSFYYAMELLEGLDLQHLVERFGPLPASRVASILRQICLSLAEAHEAGMVHRDIKPRNVFLTRLGVEYDFVKVLDFGLVKRADSVATRSLTLEGAAAGTPAYMAPEMAMGAAVDARADLYSLGCVAYWLLTGHPVFEKDSPMAVALAHVNEAPAAPSTRAELEIPRVLEELTMRCLAKEPDRRPASALAVVAALDAMDLPPWTAAASAEWWRTHLPAPAGAQTA